MPELPRYAREWLEADPDRRPTPATFQREAVLWASEAVYQAAMGNIAGVRLSTYRCQVMMWAYQLTKQEESHAE